MLQQTGLASSNQSITLFREEQNARQYCMMLILACRSLKEMLFTILNTHNKWTQTSTLQGGNCLLIKIAIFWDIAPCNRVDTYSLLVKQVASILRLDDYAMYETSTKQPTSISVACRTQRPMQKRGWHRETATCFMAVSHLANASVLTMETSLTELYLTLTGLTLHLRRQSSWPRLPEPPILHVQYWLDRGN